MLGFVPAVVTELSRLDPMGRIDLMADYLHDKVRGGRDIALGVLTMLSVAGIEEDPDVEPLQRAAFVDYFGRMLQDFGVQVVQMKPEKE